MNSKKLKKIFFFYPFYWVLKLNENADFAAWGNVNYLSIVHTVYRQVSILFIFKHDFRWRIDFGPNRPWKGFAWASTHLHVPRCNLSFLPPSIREVGKEKMSILELNSIGLECLTQGWHQFRGCQLWFCFDQFEYLLFSNNLIIVCLEFNLARDCRFDLFDFKKSIIWICN